MQIQLCPADLTNCLVSTSYMAIASRVRKGRDLLVGLFHVVVISYLISGYFIMGILEKIAEIESEVCTSV